MQDELRVLEQRWGFALHSAHFGVWDLDIVNQRVHYSPQWKAMLGYSDADEPDSTTTWRARVHPDDLARMLATLVAHIDGHTPAYECEFRIRAADGRYLWVLSRGRLVESSPEGRALRMVGTLTDLTDRKEAENLRIERDRAEASNRAKTEFLARMSHELRTPLNAVLGFAQLLSQQLGEGDVAEQRRSVAHIEDAGWQLLTLIDDVLDIARIERGQLALRLEPIALAPHVRAACESMTAFAQQRDVTIRVGDMPAGATVLADATRLRQALGNLLGNAIKYGRAGGSATLTLTHAPPAWQLSVADDGIGISAVQMAHLFEPFNRLGRERSGASGVGIGLVLTRWLVEAMNGALAVQSTEGIGSTFSISLPDVPAGAEV